MKSTSLRTSTQGLLFVGEAVATGGRGGCGGNSRQASHFVRPAMSNLGMSGRKGHRPFTEVILLQGEAQMPRALTAESHLVGCVIGVRDKISWTALKLRRPLPNYTTRAAPPKFFSCGSKTRFASGNRLLRRRGGLGSRRLIGELQSRNECDLHVESLILFIPSCHCWKTPSSMASQSQQLFYGFSPHKARADRLGKDSMVSRGRLAL